MRQQKFNNNICLLFKWGVCQMVIILTHVAIDGFHGEEDENYEFAESQKCGDDGGD